MTAPPRTPSAALSRRGLLHGAAVAVGGGALLVGGLGAGAARAATKKLSQSMAAYQAKPMGKARCDGCTQWTPPASCKTVAGAISPSGWCSLFAPKT